MPESKRRKPRHTGPTRSRDHKVAAAARTKPPSPRLYVWTMMGLLAVGVLMVIARFVFSLDLWVTLSGLGAITIGFLMLTNYR
jgi:hypothetical protein